MYSGAGTNFKVCGGGTRSARSAGNNFFLVVPPPLFGSTSTISHFGEHFRDGRYSLVSFVFAVLIFRAQPSVKVGATCLPPVPCGVGATGYVQL